MSSSTDVTSYIDALTVDWQADIARTLHARIHEAIPDVTERIQYSKPHYLKNGKYACVIGIAKGWVAFTIFNATNIDAPKTSSNPAPPSAKPSKSSPTNPSTTTSSPPSSARPQPPSSRESSVASRQSSVNCSRL